MVERKWKMYLKAKDMTDYMKSETKNIKTNDEVGAKWSNFEIFSVPPWNPPISTEYAVVACARL